MIIWDLGVFPQFSLTLFILHLYNGHPYSYAWLCLSVWVGGWLSEAFTPGPPPPPPPHLWAHLPVSGFLWSESNCVAWSLSGSDQTTGLQKQSSASLRWPFQQWCNVPSHPYKGGASGEERGGGLSLEIVWVWILDQEAYAVMDKIIPERGKYIYLTPGFYTNRKKRP